MRNYLSLLFFLLSFHSMLHAQDFIQSSKNAFLVTRMAEKFHLNPRPLNDSFSTDVFSVVINMLDRDKIYFTQKDIKSLKQFKTRIDDEIRLQDTSFLSAVSDIYIRRLHAADSAINIICSKPFDFSLKESITSEALDSNPADGKAWNSKLHKIIKGSVLFKILDNQEIFSMSSGDQNRYVDSIEPLTRQRIQTDYHNNIQTILNGPGGASQFVGDAYCKAIALCYDPHTEYFPISEKENFESELGDKSMAFGFQFKKSDDGSFQIDNVLPGSPAYKSGQINKGDKIQSIQWDAQAPINVADVDWKSLTRALDLSNHGKATFQIKKQDGSIKSVTLWKEKLDEENEENKVKSFILNGNKKIGFISLPTFYQDWDDRKAGINGCANDIAKEILKLRKEKIEGLILDLRYNGGGSVTEAVELAGIFVDAGPVAQVKGRDSLSFMLKDVNRGTIYDGPLVLMVNGYTASASELLAGTLQDYHRAIIVGTPTYGKATAQIILPLDTTIEEKTRSSEPKVDQFIKVTISQLYRVDGTTAQGNGVLPDIVLPDLSESVLSREKDQPFYIKSSFISPVKHYRALTKADLAPLQRLAKNQMDSSSYFILLKKYIDFSKSGDTTSTYSLRLTDALAKQPEMKEESLGHGTDSKSHTDFTIENNSYEKQQMQTNESLKEMNAQWASFLMYDPQLRITFNIISKMIK